MGIRILEKCWQHFFSLCKQHPSCLCGTMAVLTSWPNTFFIYSFRLLISGFQLSRLLFCSFGADDGPPYCNRNPTLIFLLMFLQQLQWNVTQNCTSRRYACMSKPNNESSPPVRDISENTVVLLASA